MFLQIILGKFVLKLSKVLGLGSGSTWPGHIALKKNKYFIRNVIRKNPKLKIVFIAGTNGKTTTTKALEHILNSSDVSTFTNNTGANLLNGLASTLISNANIKGILSKKCLIFEVDENSLPQILKEIEQPDSIILLNLFRDQLDRYGELNTIFEKWKKAFEKLSDKTLVVANADDPKIAYATLFAKKRAFFSLNDNLKIETKLSHAVDSTTCPKCNYPLIYTKIAYSHLGNYKCENCGFKNPMSNSYEPATLLLGNYNLYNLAAAIVVAKNVFGIKEVDSINTLKNFTPAFGRQEIIYKNEKKIMLLLSKNPTGFNESLKVAIENKSYALLILLNDRIPDGRDISWIWDVDFEILKNAKIKIFVSGDRVYDIANRLLFAGVIPEFFESQRPAYESSIAKTPVGKTLTILPTYSALLDIRKLISGRKIL